MKKQLIGRCGVARVKKISLQWHKVVNWNVTEADKMNLGVDSKDTGLEFDFSGVKYVADTNCQLAVLQLRQRNNGSRFTSKHVIVEA